ncbi:hypothetical protein ACWG0P_13960 [Amedibacillus sp. YH-ame6]
MNLMELTKICIAVVIIVFTICISVSFINTLLNERKKRVLELREREIETIKTQNDEQQRQVDLMSQIIPLMKEIERFQK